MLVGMSRFYPNPIIEVLREAHCGRELGVYFLPDRHNVAPGLFALVHQLVCPMDQAFGRIS